MLEIEKLKKRFESDSPTDVMKEYDRDFLKSPKEEIPPNPPAQPPPSDDLFAKKGDQKLKKKDS
jgi:hypothetical protein